MRKFVLRMVFQDGLRIPPFTFSNASLCLLVLFFNSLVCVSVFGRPDAGIKLPIRISNLSQLPVYFESNQGQTDGHVKFISRSSGYNLFLKPAETVMVVKGAVKGRKGADSSNKHVDKAGSYSIIHMRLLDANTNTVLKGNNELPGKVNYFVGKSESDWIRDVPIYSDVTAKDIYPGIDLRYHGEQKEMEYDFVVSQGADVDKIRLSFTGIDDYTINNDGELVLKTRDGEIHHKKPLFYQDIHGKKVLVKGSYRVLQKPAITGNNSLTIGFQVDAYDSRHDLIIDPVVDFSTFLGSEGQDAGFSIAVDKDSNVYVGGATTSLAFPLDNAPQNDLLGRQDSFVVKLSPDGQQLLYATYLGGSGRGRRHHAASRSDDYEDETVWWDKGGSKRRYAISTGRIVSTLMTRVRFILPA